MIDERDEFFMARALELARQGRGLTSPNPMVGAVLVKEGRIVAEGFHRYAEKNHAEVNAIEAAGNQTKGSTLYINLEPCSHYGRTPPCVQRVIEAGIVRVVAAMQDPNPQVCGDGFRQIREAGIELNVGVGKLEAQFLNEAYSKYIQTRRPWVIMKTAMTLDGKIAQSDGHSQWISSEFSRQRVQQLRFDCDAVLTGIGTILKDDPVLTDRTGRKRRRPLLRCVMDSQLRLPPHSHLVQSKPEGGIIVFCLPEHDAAHQGLLENQGVEVVVAPKVGKRVSFESVLQELGQRGITSLLIEAGSAINYSAFQQRVVDKVCCFISPKILGGKSPLPFIGDPGFKYLNETIKLSFSSIERVGPDLLVEAYVELAELTGE
jgi:diaminohydroxyphosphoribosylaminopyrimidine deaminase / 5-amino-6-(5-phosphoribosylamino)uracil reductase